VRRFDQAAPASRLRSATRKSSSLCAGPRSSDQADLDIENLARATGRCSVGCRIHATALVRTGNPSLLSASSRKGPLVLSGITDARVTREGTAQLHARTPGPTQQAGVGRYMKPAEFLLGVKTLPWVSSTARQTPQLFPTPWQDPRSGARGTGPGARFAAKITQNCDAEILVAIRSVLGAAGFRNCPGL